MGDGLAEFALYVLILYAIVFLIGFAIVFFPSMLLIRSFKNRPMMFRFPALVLAVSLSVVGGLFAIRFLLAWDSAERRDFAAEKSAFGQKMAQEYPFEMKYQPDHPFDQQFKIIFSVPVSASYDLHIKGFAPGATIKVDKYRVPLEAGTNELVFGFADATSFMQVHKSIDFIVVIQPTTAREKLLNTQEGIGVDSPGRVVLTEGINYYSPKIPGGSSEGCLTAFYQWVPCLGDDQLHIDLVK